MTASLRDEKSNLEQKIFQLEEANKKEKETYGTQSKLMMEKQLYLEKQCNTLLSQKQEIQKELDLQKAHGEEQNSIHKLEIRGLEKARNHLSIENEIITGEKKSILEDMEVNKNDLIEMKEKVFNCIKERDDLKAKLEIVSASNKENVQILQLKLS